MPAELMKLKFIRCLILVIHQSLISHKHDKRAELGHILPLITNSKSYMGNPVPPSYLTF